MCYTPNVVGRHQIWVRLRGEHIRGSPYEIVVTGCNIVSDPRQNRRSLSKMSDSNSLLVNPSERVALAQEFPGPCAAQTTPMHTERRVWSNYFDEDALD